MTDFDDELEAAEHASCMLFDADFPPWRVDRLRWGFPSKPPPRMTLVVVTGLLFRHISIDLEDNLGNRAFLVHGPLPERVRMPLHTWVTAHRDQVEAAWVTVMISEGWLRIQTGGRVVEIVAYPDHAGFIQRTLDCSQCPVWMEDDDVAMRDEMLVLGVRNQPRAQVRSPLNRLIWTGRDDGSDAGTIPF